MNYKKLKNNIIKIIIKILNFLTEKCLVKLEKITQEDKWEEWEEKEIMVKE